MAFKESSLVLCTFTNLISPDLINPRADPGLVGPAAAAAKSLQLCLTLCDPIDGSPPVSSIHGIFQARILEWGATAFSRHSNLRKESSLRKGNKIRYKSKHAF